MNSQNTPHTSPLRASHGNTFYEFFGEQVPRDIESALHLGDGSHGSEEGKTGPKPVSLCEMSPVYLPGLPRVKPFTVIMQAPQVYVSNLRIVNREIQIQILYFIKGQYFMACFSSTSQATLLIHEARVKSAALELWVTR